MSVPSIRVRICNRQDFNPKGKYVLYWMNAARRVDSNFAIDRSIEISNTLKKPILIFEGIRQGYRWANDRHHLFVMQGMLDQAQALKTKGVSYYPYVEEELGAGKGLIEELAKHACAVVTDDYPAFFLPRMVKAAAKRIQVRMEAIDGNGLYPMRATDRVFTVAHSFRRHLQKELPDHIQHGPKTWRVKEHHKGAKVPAAIRKTWPDATKRLQTLQVSDLAIDHDVGMSGLVGGSKAAKAQLRQFMSRRLSNYGERNHPDEEAASGLSPWLHFGHIGAHQIWKSLTKLEDWQLSQIGSVNGKRTGFWNMSEAAEGFVDELVTWREIGFNKCTHDPGYDRFDSLPDWAQETLHQHRNDKRPYLYSMEEFDQGLTHDPIWNAAQRQLVEDGRMHNYLRMLWGKKILHWTPSPKVALDTMIELNNRYALDGRDPNSYSGIFWVLGRYDRAWGPERPVFGKVRYMTSQSTARKLKMSEYLSRWGKQGELQF